MNNKKIILSNFIILIFILIIFIRKDILFDNIYKTFIIFWKNSFPPLFISIIISNILIFYNFPYYLSLFIKNYSLRMFILSIAMGFPSNTILIKNDLIKKIINEKDASLLICFTTITSPLYIIFTFTKIIKNGFIFIFLYYSFYFIIFLICYRKISNPNLNKKYNKGSIKDFINNMIPNTMIMLLNILSIIMFFSIFTSLITSNSLLSGLLKGLIEFTSGINSLSLINYSSNKKGIIALIILLFNSLSIHLQLSYQLKDYNINYKYFYRSKLIGVIVPSIKRKD